MYSEPEEMEKLPDALMERHLVPPQNIIAMFEALDEFYGK
jgi:hypothetical protein